MNIDLEVALKGGKTSIDLETVSRLIGDNWARQSDVLGDEKYQCNFMKRTDGKWRAVVKGGECK